MPVAVGKFILHIMVSKCFPQKNKTELYGEIIDLLCTLMVEVDPGTLFFGAKNKDVLKDCWDIQKDIGSCLKGSPYEKK